MSLGLHAHPRIAFVLRICFFALLAFVGAIAGCQVGNRYRIEADEAAGISWKEPLLTDWEVGGFLAGGALGLATGLIVLVLGARRKMPS